MSLRGWAVKVVYDELVAILGTRRDPRLRRHRVMLVGLYGQGHEIVHQYFRLHEKVGIASRDGGSLSRNLRIEIKSPLVEQKK